MKWGSGCGSVGRADASITRGPRFESGHQQSFMMNLFSVDCGKDENKEKGTGHGPIFKKNAQN